MLNPRKRSHSSDQAGFSLIELMATIALISLLMVLGASAARHYWFVQSLEGSRDEVTTQLRGLQQRVISETFPLVYGARFVPGSSAWKHVQYNPSTTECTQVFEGDFDGGQFNGGVRLQSAAFESFISNGVDVTAKCAAGIAGAQVVFFFARGTATKGTLTLVQPVLNRTTSVCVTGITGRVDEKEGATCPV